MELAFLYIYKTEGLTTSYVLEVHFLVCLSTASFPAIKQALDQRTRLAQCLAQNRLNKISFFLSTPKPGLVYRSPKQLKVMENPKSDTV